MSNLLDSAIQKLYAYVDRRIEGVRPFRAIVAGQSGGMVQLRRLGDTTGSDQLHARLAGASLVTNDEVLVAQLPDRSGRSQLVVLDKIQRTTPVTPPIRTRREIISYAGASTGGSFVTVGFQNAPAVTSPTNSNADSTRGFFLQHTTTTTPNNVVSVVAGTNSGVRLDWLPDIAFAVRIPPTITSMRTWWGLFASTPSASDDPAIEGFGFRYSTGASDANLMAWSNDGTSGGTVTDTGVAVASGDGHELRAVVNADATAIDYYVDGAWTARHTTNLPAATTLLDYGIYCTTLTAAQRAMRWGRITLESEP